LTAAEVRDIRKAFQMLSPYPDDVAPQFLKLEAEGRAYSIAANRNCLRLADGSFAKESSHGLGGIIPPHGERLSEFCEQLWRAVLSGERPSEWERQLLRRRFPIRKPATWHLAQSMLPDRDYSGSIKPFNFLQSVKPSSAYGRVGGQCSDRTLYAPYRCDDWDSLRLKWRDRKTGEVFRVVPRVGANAGRDGLQYVQTVADFLDDFESHPEVKMAGLGGEPCRPATHGLLSPRPVLRKGAYLIGKESDRLDGALASESDDEADPTRVIDELEPSNGTRAPVRSPALIAAIAKLEWESPRDIATALEISPEQWRRIRKGEREPSDLTRSNILRIAHQARLTTGN
jgi:hypothetical protein